MNGNLGDTKFVGEGVFEMREHFGCGWRMYYVQRGDKSTQASDISKAQKLASTLEQNMNIADLPDFDPAEYLKTEEDIAAYLTCIL